MMLGSDTDTRFYRIIDQTNALSSGSGPCITKRMKCTDTSCNDNVLVHGFWTKLVMVERANNGMDSLKRL